MLKKDVISRRNWHSFQGLSPALPLKITPSGRGNVPVARNLNPPTQSTSHLGGATSSLPATPTRNRTNAKIKLSAKTARCRNQISSLLGVPPLKFLSHTRALGRPFPTISFHFTAYCKTATHFPYFVGGGNISPVSTSSAPASDALRGDMTLRPVFCSISIRAFLATLPPLAATL